MNRNALTVASITLAAGLLWASEALAQPTPSSPSGGILNPMPTYTWTAKSGATWYSVQTFIYNTSTGAWDFRYQYLQMPVTPGMCPPASSTCSWNPGEVLAVGSYKWYVRADNSAWSGELGFQVNPPAAPTPVTPTGTVAVSQPIFQWLASAGATGYQLEALDVDYSPPRAYFYPNVPASVCSNGTCSYNPGVNLEVGNYVWHVRGFHQGGVGAMSADLSFHVSPASWPGHGCPGTSAGGDFNGDGHTDRLCSKDGVVYVSLSSSTGLAPGTPWLIYEFKHPIAVDLNGDGKTDIADYDMMTGEFKAAFAQTSGNAFAPPVSWGVATAQSLTCRLGTAVVGAGDFDGDGKADVFCRRPDQDPRYVFVGRNTGSSFSFSIFGSLTCDVGQERVGAMDLDGDGLTDWYCLDHLGRFYAQLSNGTSFVPNSFTALALSYCDPSSYQFSDLNGDGAPDIVCPLNGNVAISTGHSFIDQGSFGGFCAMVTNMFAADLDADGVAEIICQQGADNRSLMVRRWTGTQLLAPTTLGSHFCDNDALGGGDFDGDGRTDLLCGMSSVGITGTTGIVPDLMISASNGLGGTTSVQYTSSSAFPTTNNPGVQPLVTAVTTNDGRGGVATSTYAYSGAKVDPLEGFLGFASITKTLPCLAGETTCPYVMRTYSQDLPSRGQPASLQRGDGAGYVLQRVQYFYQTQAGPNPPRTALPREVRTTDYGLTGSSKTTSISYAYGAYGNQTQALSHGLVNPDGSEIPGDELVTNLTYRAADTNLYMVDRVASSQQTDSGGAVLTSVEDTYNTAGDLTNVRTLVKAEGQADRYVNRTMGYDSATGNVISSLSEMGGLTTFGYDADNLHVQTVTNPALEVVTTITDPICGQPTQVIDANNQTTHTTYDPLCRPSHTDLPNGGFVERSYALTGDPQTQHARVETPGTGGNDYGENYFDGFGRVYRTRKRGPTSADILVDRDYNARGGVSSSTDPYFEGDNPGVTNFSYDHFDRPRVTTHPDGTHTSKSYDLWSETTTDANGKPVTTTRTSTLTSVETKTINGQPVTTTSTYDVLGRLTRLQDNVANVWTWKYDSLGRTVYRNDPDAGLWTYVYSEASRTTTQTDAKSQVIVSSFDTAGRLATKTSNSGITTFGYSEPRGSYMNIGRLTSVTSPGTVLTIDYDALGNAVRKTRAIDSYTFTMQADYDQAGRVASVTYPDMSDGTCSVAGTCTIGPIEYDRGGRVTQVAGILTAVTYDATGRPLVQTNANGTVTTRAYWPQRGLLHTLATTTPTQQNPVQSLTYADYDDVGNLLQVTGTYEGESWQYGYDDGYRLTSASYGPTNQQTFQYDSIGRMTYNSLVGTYAYPLRPGQPRPHAPQAVSSLGSFAYDSNGNLLAGAGRTLTWNAENLPTQITAGATTASFTYDGLGERVKNASTTGTSYYPFGDDYEITGGVVTKYVSIPGLGVVAKQVGTGTSIKTYWLHTDRLGSINAITSDGSQFPAGTVLFRRTYHPYGETLVTYGTLTESRGWIDQRNDGETGLTYLHARYYDPRLGLFLSADPIGVQGGMNQYAYVGGSPVNGTDRLGLEDPLACGFDRDGNVSCPGGSFPVEVIRYWPEDPYDYWPGGAEHGHGPFRGYYPGQVYDPIAERPDRSVYQPPEQQPRDEPEDPEVHCSDQTCKKEEPKAEEAKESSKKTFVFKDPCTSSWAQRFWDNEDYLHSEGAGLVGTAIEIGEGGLYSAYFTSMAAYAESAARHGGSLQPLAPGGFLGTEWLGRAGIGTTLTHLVGRSMFVFGIGISFGDILAAGVVATTANDHCR